MISTKSRIPTSDFVYKLSTAMGLNETEHEYANLLLAYERAGCEGEKEIYRKNMSAYRIDEGFQELEIGPHANNEDGSPHNNYR